MKFFLVTLFFCSSLLILAQPAPYEELVLSFSGEINPSKSILTGTMKSRVIKQLKMTKPSDYIILATRADNSDKNVAVVQRAKTKVAAAWIFYDGAENIIQTTLFRSMISPAAITKAKAAAVAKGLSRTDPNTDFIKISNKTGTWYKVVGIVDGAFGFIFLSETFTFLSKEGEEH